MMNLILYFMIVVWLRRWIPGAEGMLSFAGKWALCKVVWEFVRLTVDNVDPNLILNNTKH